MTDVHDKLTRSFNMSRIQGKNTKPELIVRKALFSLGFRFRLHDKKLPGKPDIILPKYHTLIFIHGCFWHGHKNCKYFKVPKTRTEWWIQKIDKNRSNDNKVTSALKGDGWNVIILWECALKGNKSNKNINNLVTKILSHGNEFH